MPDLRVRCNKCIGCIKYRKRTWAARLLAESRCHNQNAFLTLTYDEDHIPADHKINKRDIDLFLKRLRNNYGKLRYFLTGEYGEKTKRPHYHAIIFGHDFLGGATSLRNHEFENRILDAIWRHGKVVIGTVTPESCAYVAGYVQKKIKETDTFSLMSKFPPIGKEWVLREENLDNMRRQRCLRSIEGFEEPIPGKYREWIKKERPEETWWIEELREDAQDPKTDYQLDSKKLHLQSLDSIYTSGKL